VQRLGAQREDDCRPESGGQSDQAATAVGGKQRRGKQNSNSE
jgi:hypothetical protein